jgi:DNA-binding FrmR family transcriptional regulator
MRSTRRVAPIAPSKTNGGERLTYSAPDSDLKISPAYAPEKVEASRFLSSAGGINGDGCQVIDRLTHHTLGGYDGEMAGYTKDKQKIETRLRRIEGQVRGIQKMVAEDRYCIDVLTQVNATRAALESVALQLLADHTEHCVTEAIRSGGGSKKVRELNDAIERLVRA